ncbi:glycosyltransferase [Clostridium sp. DL1XJH146]
MKVLMISGSYKLEKCGVGDYTVKLCKELGKFDDIDLYILNSRHLYKSNSILNTHLIKWKIKDLIYLSNLVNNINPDIVHIQFPTKSYRKSLAIVIFMILTMFKKYKLVLTLHEFSYSNILAKARTWPGIIAAKKIIVVDEKYKQEIESINYKYCDKVKTIHIASSMPKNNLNTDIKIMNFKKNYNINNELLIGYFGFINKSKGVEYILLLTKKIVESGFNVKLLIISELNKNDRYHKELKDKIKYLNLVNNVYITGYLNEQDVSNTIKICDFMVYPFIEGLSPKNSSFLAAELQNVKIITTCPEKSYKCLEFGNNVFFVDNAKNIEEMERIIITNYKNSNKEIFVEDSWQEIASLTSDLYKSISN